MPDAFVDTVRQVGLSLAIADWGVAEAAVAHRDSQAWKQWTKADGTHPSTFGSFLDDFTDGLRTGRLNSGMSLDISSGKLRDLIDLYEWMTSLGFDQPQMGLLGFKRLLGIRRATQDKTPEEQTEEVNRAFGVIETLGEADTFTDKQATVKPELVVEELPNGDVRLLGLVAWRDGVPERNVLKVGTLRFLSKRLRARVTFTTREAFQKELAKSAEAKRLEIGAH